MSVARLGKSGRWALSFADLCLLLLGFFVLLHATQEQDRRRALASIGAELGGDAGAAAAGTEPLRLPADSLFVPREAMLTAKGRAVIAAFANETKAKGRLIQLSSTGIAEKSGRFDAWDLASARLGAVARALVQADVPAQDIALLGAETADRSSGGHMILVRMLPKPPPHDQ